MSIPSGNVHLGDAIYQSHFGDQNAGENNLAGGTHTRFFGQSTNPPTSHLPGNSAHFSQCLYMVYPNGTSSPTYFAPQNVVPASAIGPAVVTQSPTTPNSVSVNSMTQPPQQQPTFVLNLIDGQPIPCMPIQQVLVATQGQVTTSPVFANGNFPGTPNGGNGTNMQSDGYLADNVREGGLTPLQPVYLNDQQMATGSPGVSLSPTPLTHVSAPPLGFSRHFASCSLVQNGSNSLHEETSNNNGSSGGSSSNGNTNNNNNNNSLPVDEERVEVYAPDFTSVISLPASSILHRPPPSLGVSRLVLCRKYIPGRPDSCWKGSMCKFVHADPTGAPRSPIHVNYSWNSVERCTYPHLPPGEMILVLAPNGRQPAETFPSERVLVTRGSLNRKSHVGPLSRCAHYYFNRLCNRGEDCNFIHTMHVDPNVDVDFKRAPASTTIAPIKRRGSRTKTTSSTAGDEATCGITPLQNVTVGTSQQDVGATIAINGISTTTTTTGITSASDLGGGDPNTNMVSPSGQGFYLAVPQRATLSLSRSLSSVGGGSARSSNSGATNPMEWSFVENLETSLWSDGDTSPML
ncbi:zinc finger protein family memeber [Trypanosoma theileri]|uniref:Zinc finger protein family memeber n=1 Tax=Trypanosoma theileri TaxID=67003 RepID=A0A1X0P7A7_9TRYP|nr:zinc finger protein family memeber [Trypanosoma theileri]ORC92725.1 zinc finger protein family memeber [Trypanosoma theileri]